MKKKSYACIFVFCMPIAACHQKAPSNPPTPPPKTPGYTIEQFINSPQTDGGQFSSDSKRLLISSNQSGVFNVYEIDIASGSQTQLTHADKESIFADDYVPGTHHFICNSDKGGNENSHLYLYKSDGAITDLTPGENEKAFFLGWSKNDRWMYFASNKRDPRVFDLYKADTVHWKPVLLYKNTGMFTITPSSVVFSSDNRYAALTKVNTFSSSEIYLVDLKTQATRLLITSKEENNFTPACFSPNNLWLYYLSNEHSEYQHVVKYNIANRTQKTEASPQWDVMYTQLSRKGTYQITGVNEDGRNKLYIYNRLSHEEIPLPNIEDGSIQDVQFNRQENLMRLVVGNSKSPDNIYIFNLANRQLNKLTNTLNSQIKPENLVEAKSVSYRSFDSLLIPAFLYNSQPDSPGTKMPALVWVHGGPGDQSKATYSPFIQYLVNHGYTVLAVNNRGSSGYGKTFFSLDNKDHGNKDLKDCIWGKKYLAGLPHVDSSKIGIIGGSYGGYLTLAALAFHPDEFAVGVDMFGISNWLRTLREIPPYWNTVKKALYTEVGDPDTIDSVRLKKYSPLTQAASINRPLMVMQGANDPRILKVESDEIVTAVKNRNVPVEYIVFPDEGHGFLKRENEIKGYHQVLLFLDKYLKEGFNKQQPD